MLSLAAVGTACMSPEEQDLIDKLCERIDEERDLGVFRQLVYFAVKGGHA